MDVFREWVILRFCIPRLTPVSRERPVGMCWAGVGGAEPHTKHEPMEHKVRNGDGSLSSVFKLLTYHNREAEPPSVICSGKRQPNTETADHLCKHILLWVCLSLSL